MLRQKNLRRPATASTVWCFRFPAAASKRDFVGAEYHRQHAWPAHRTHLGHASGVAESHFKEELQSGDRGVERNRRDAVIVYCDRFSS
ncbi:hypothetical protein Tamer19_07140 [Cupriavidus sp. TA19]|nr:hypothetical protein Tamer19_07140 [Cupriavidus sp. TA19]